MSLMNRASRLPGFVAAKIASRNPVAAARWLRAPDPAWTLRLLEECGSSVGDDVRIKGALIVDNYLARDGYSGDLSNLVLGDGCYIGEDVYVDLADKVSVGAGAMVSARCVVVTHQNAHRSPWVAERFPASTDPVVIGKGAWVGVSVTVLPGVTIGDEAVVAAGALVISDVTARTLVGGVPARPLRAH